MKDLPDQVAQTMRDCPACGLVAEAWQQTPEHCLEVDTFAAGSGMSRLVEDTAHVFVAFRRTAAGALFGAFLFPGQVPTQEVDSVAEGNVLAVTPTSAITCCAESMPRPGTRPDRSGGGTVHRRNLPLFPSIRPLVAKGEPFTKVSFPAAVVSREEILAEEFDFCNYNV
jgi:hypothetical protein